MCSVVFRHLTIVASFVIIIPFLSYSSLADAGQCFSKGKGGCATGKPEEGETFSSQSYRYTNTQTGETNNWSVRVLVDDERTTVVTEIDTSEVSDIGRIRRGYEVHGYNPESQSSAEVAASDTDSPEYLVSVATDRPYFTEGAQEGASAPGAEEASPPNERRVRVVRSPALRPFLLLGMPMVNPGEIPEMTLRSLNLDDGECVGQFVSSNTEVTFSYDNETGRFNRIEIPGSGIVLEATEEPVSRSVAEATDGAAAQVNENPTVDVPEPLLPGSNDLSEAAAATVGVTVNGVSF